MKLKKWALTINLQEEQLIEKKSHFFHNSIIREYDIRGIYGVTLFNKDAEILGNLFGKIVGTDKKINVNNEGKKVMVLLLPQVKAMTLLQNA